MKLTFLPGAVYKILFALLAIVYIIGLFVPLMDNDSAHHANIALHMYLTGDYVSLVDAGKDYLDKPHLHFWLSAFSYNLFGVGTFAYKFPSFLFTILGTYSTYRLGKSLYSSEVGKGAALIVASAFAYILANNDVRMDAILTASIVFATWQLTDWVHHKKIINAIGAALGLALGFATKGHIAVATPAIGIFFYILYKKDWKAFYHPQLLAIIGFFFVFISPVVYAYYLQYDMHPEKVVRGRSGISGVKFILWQQNVERFEGDSFGSDAKNDYFFFLHSFLWAFAPWSIIGFLAFFSRLQTFFNKRYEWLTVSAFAAIMIIISLSGFKLPHYLNIVFPVAAVFTASYLLEKKGKELFINRLAIVQIVICSLLILALVVLNAVAFPVHNLWVIAGLVVLILLSLFIIKNVTKKLHQLVAITTLTAIFIFYLLNANFYPQLLQYQAGGPLAKVINNKVGGQNVYFDEGMQSWSLNFYTATLRQPYNDSLLTTGKPVWIVTDGNGIQKWRLGYRLGKIYTRNDYEITRLGIKFINPATRKMALNKMMLAEVLGKK